jgi:hypothetical protein
MEARQHHLQRRFKALGPGCLLPIVAIVAVFYGAFKFVEHQVHLNHMPADLEVTGILYWNEKNWGSIFLPMPGDNETGIFLYGLPATVADKITAEGLDFFRRPENEERRIGRQTTHSEWHETPIAEDGHWSIQRHGAKLSDYLNQYGFGIEVDPSVETLVNDAIAKPGSFYSFGRTGLVVVIPTARRAIFAYAG